MGDDFDLSDFGDIDSSGDISDAYSAIGNIDGSAVLTGTGATSVPSYNSTDLFSLNPAPTTSSTATTLNEVSQGTGILASLGNIAGSLFKTVSAPNVAGTYNAQGQFVPLGSSSGLISVPGQTSILGNGIASPYAASNIASSIGTTLSSTLGSLTPLVPYLLIGAVILFVFKIGKKL